MISILARIFIKDSKNYTNPQVRGKYGVLCSGFGIFLNVLLFGFKFFVGTISSSVAVTADAFNNLSDAASSLVTILGFKLAGKKPDEDHPFGHGRIEYIAGLIVSFLICLMGFELLKSSISSIRNPVPVEGGIIPVVVMAAAILVKLYMYLYNHSIGKKINSPTMEAVAKDSFGDVIATSVVILSIVLSKFTTLPVDGSGGLVVAFFILKSGYEAAMETMNPLLGLPPEKEFVRAIEAETLAHKPICGIHDLVVHDYGPGRVMISLHAEVPGNMNIFEMHDVIDCAEVDIAKKFGCFVTIHLDPIDTENAQLAELKKEAAQIAKSIDERITIHDVRMVPGTTHTNLIFDAVRPHDCKLSHEELKKTINEKINEKHGDVNCVITVDDPYV